MLVNLFNHFIHSLVRALVKNGSLGFCEGWGNGKTKCTICGLVFYTDAQRKSICHGGLISTIVPTRTKAHRKYKTTNKHVSRLVTNAMLWACAFLFGCIVFLILFRAYNFRQFVLRKCKVIRVTCYDKVCRNNISINDDFLHFLPHLLLRLFRPLS